MGAAPGAVSYTHLDVYKRQVTDPLDEDIALWTFRALDALHMQRAIVIAYNKTARYFEEEMGRPLCAEIGSIYAAAAEAVNKTEQDFAAIRDELSDALRSQRSDRGAFYCNYEVFKRMYAIVARTAQRARQVVALMLITVQDVYKRQERKNPPWKPACPAAPA